MTAASSAPQAAPLDDAALIEIGRANASAHLERRDWTGALGQTIAFFVVAACALAVPSHRQISIVAVLVTVACYALASRVRFEYGGVFAVPTEPVFIAMWFLLPPRLLPLAICTGLLLSELPEIVTGKTPVDRLANWVAASWFSVGPALVIYLFATHEPRWSDAPVYAGALGAQLLFDFTSTFLIARPAVGVGLVEHFRSMRASMTVDVLLAPLGLLVAFVVSAQPLTLLLVLPTLLLFATFARERQHRIDHALELSSAYRGTAMLLGDVIEADDEYTGSHSRDVVDLVVAVADELGLEARDRTRAEFAALLHDVGKVKIPAEIINKPGALDDAEWELMKTHTVLGEQMLDRIGGLLGEVGTIVRSCHERWDGNGYPDRLAGEEIPLAARIVCACDAWSAMTTDRSYRKARSDEEAAAELRASAGTHFDPRVVDALLAVLDA